MIALTRTEALARAFKGTVIEDVGYRGVIFVPDESEGKYLRYHPGGGVHLVQRVGTKWRSLQLVMKAEEVDAFLDKLGLLPKTSVPNPAEVLARVFGGEVVVRFDTGGGVTLVNWKGKLYYLRTSQISGLDFVQKVLSKWRTYKSVWSRRELFNIITHIPDDFKPAGENIDTALESMRKEVKPDDRTDPELHPDGGGDQGSNGQDCSPEGAQEAIR